MARAIEAKGGREFPLTHVDDPMTLQVYLNTLRRPVSLDRAARLLSGGAASFVAVTDLEALEACNTNGFPWHVLLRTPAYVRRRAVTIVSNQPELDAGTNYAFCFSEWHFQAKDARLTTATEREVCFQAASAAARITIANEAATPRAISVVLEQDGRRTRHTPRLEPGETRVLPGAGKERQSVK
jgi:hypothetical protein